MDEWGDVFYTLNRFGYRIRGTLSIVSLILVAYATQLAIAGSLHTEVAFTIVREYLQPFPGLYLFISPLAHSSHPHVLVNLVFLLIGGAITEQLLGWEGLLVFVYVSAALSNFVPGVIGPWAAGLGLSAANFGLWMFFGLMYGYKCFRNWRDERGQPSIAECLLSIFGVSYAGFGVLQFLGVFPTQPGTARMAHLLGVVFGVLWFAYYRSNVEVARSEMLQRV